MRNIGNIIHNGRVMYVQLTDTGHVYLSGYPVEQYSRQIQEIVGDKVRAFKG